MANRIPPPDPESNRLSQAKKLEEAQKIAAISSVDPDAQAKKRRFQQMMDAENEETKVEEQQPTPYQTSFYQSKEPLNLNSIRTPSDSPPPDLNAFSPDAEDLISDEGLPQSPEYWNQVDLPDQPLDEQPQLTQQTSPQQQQQSQQQQQTTRQSQQAQQQPMQKKSSAEKKKSAQQGMAEQPGKEEKKLEPSPFGPPGKPVPKKDAAGYEPPPFVKSKEEMEPGPFGKKKGEEASPFAKKKMEGEVPTAKYWETPAEQAQGAPGSTKDKDKRKEKEKDLSNAPRSSHIEKPLEPQQSTPKEFSPFFQKAEAGGHGGHGEQGGGRGREAKGVVEISQPSLPAFPSTVHAEATSAATTAASYLRPEVLPLFYQMVGTIFVMTNQGISTTEILLNNPAFAGSKFFGASIEIVKYSSAPDSLNIRLTGSNEAVTAFNQNIPGLLAAFQTGGFRFRIGRIDAAYAAEKPVFRRKEKEDTLGGQKQGEGQ